MFLNEKTKAFFFQKKKKRTINSLAVEYGWFGSTKQLLNPCLASENYSFEQRSTKQMLIIERSSKQYINQKLPRDNKMYGALGNLSSSIQLMKS